MFSDKVYDTLNLIARTAGPLATLISALLAIWNVPHADQITATCAAIETFLCALVVIAKSVYDKQQKLGAEDDDNE